MTAQLIFAWLAFVLTVGSCIGYGAHRVAAYLESPARAARIAKAQAAYDLRRLIQSYY